MAIPGFQPYVDFSILGNLPRDMAFAQEMRNKTDEQAREDALRAKFAGGLPRTAGGEIDWSKAVDLAAKTGNVSSLQNLGQVAPLAKLSEERAASERFQQFARAYGGGAGAAPPAAPPVTAPGVMPPTAEGAALGDRARPKVASSPRVMGDDEAIAAGIYPAPPGYVPPPQPGPPAAPPGAPPMMPPQAGVPFVPQQAGAPRPPMPGPVAAPPAAPPPGPPPGPRPLGSGYGAPVQPPAVAPPLPNAQPPLPPSITGNPAAGRIGELFSFAGDPRNPPAVQQAAQAMLQHALKSSDLPDMQKNYLLYHAQTRAMGQQPLPFIDYEERIGRSKAMTIRTGEGFEAARDTARLNADVKAAQPVLDQVAKDQTTHAALDTMLRLAGNTPNGWAGAVAPQVASLLSGFGIPVPEKLSNAEAFAVLSRQLIPSVRDPGAVSEYEQKIYAQAVPNLSNSPEGRVLAVAMFQALAARREQVAEIYREHMGTAHLKTALAELRKQPLLSEGMLADIKRLSGMDVGPRLQGAPTLGGKTTTGVDWGYRP